MNLLPVAAHLPARKHLLAGVVALFSVGLMLVAVLGTAGLPTPFSAGNSLGVRTSPVAEAPDTTTTTTTQSAAVAAGIETSDPATSQRQGTTPTTQRTTNSSVPSTTTTTLVPPTPSTTAPDPNDLLGGLGLGRGLTGP